MLLCDFSEVFGQKTEGTKNAITKKGARSLSLLFQSLKYKIVLDWQKL